MTFIAEIKYPTKSGTSPDTRIWFDGVPANKPMRMTELMAWRNALHVFVDAVKDEAAQIKEKAAKRKA
ncbi:MAG: hypothetical protein K1X67_14055 [Fimbriimonadaceae bacterium]|nr:hypothetical protein [Fimbriimonadaceae bacterium]